MPEPRRIVPDGGIRAGLNTDSDVIPKCRIVRDHTLTDAVRLTTASTQKPKGVSLEDIAIGLTGDIQIAGKAVVESGAAYSKGDNLGSDSTGRAVAVSTTGDYVLLIASEAAGGAGEFHEAEIV